MKRRPRHHHVAFAIRCAAAAQERVAVLRSGHLGVVPLEQLLLEGLSPSLRRKHLLYTLVAELVTAFDGARAARNAACLELG